MRYPIKLSLVSKYEIYNCLDSMLQFWNKTTVCPKKITIGLSASITSKVLTLISPGYFETAYPGPPPPLISAAERATAAKFCTNIEVNVLYKIA